jgi:ubiquinone/menaquinone biosynthesis C-methylase UbiE
VELPRNFLIRESSHRIIDPITSEKLATLGAALRLQPGTRLLDLACGKGELLCTWARDHGVAGVGVDISEARYAAAQWLNVRRWIDANPDDELVPEMRAELHSAPLRHVRYQREYLGWGVFALARR